MTIKSGSGLAFIATLNSVTFAKYCSLNQPYQHEHITF